MKITSFLLITLICFGLNTISAQRDGTNSYLKKGTIQAQYDSLLRKSTNYSSSNGKRYEVIRVTSINKFKNNVLDSIRLANETLADLRATIAENTTGLSSLKSKLDQTTLNLNQISKEKDSIYFLGILLTKKTYQGITWGLILALIFLLALFIYKFRNSNYLTVQAKSALAELENEFEAHRRRALEREQKISRELHDERNKNRQKKV